MKTFTQLNPNFISQIQEVEASLTDFNLADLMTFKEFTNNANFLEKKYYLFNQEKKYVALGALAKDNILFVICIANDEAIHDIFHEFEKYNQEHQISQKIKFILLSETKAKLLENNDKLVISETNFPHYIYKYDQLASFAGKKMQKKRNLYNNFYKNYHEITKYKNIDNGNEDLKKFLINWNNDALSERQKSGYFFGVERIFSEKIIHNSKFQENKNILFYINKKPVGFISYYRSSNISTNCIFLKAFPIYKGLYQYILKETFSIISPEQRTTYINFLDDGNDEGLRKSKLSYHPTEIVKNMEALWIKT